MTAALSRGALAGGCQTGAMPRRAGGAAILAAAALWGSTGTAAHFAPAAAGPVSVGAARIVAGGALLLAIALCSKPLCSKPPARTGRGREIRQLLARPGAARAGLVLGAASTAGYQLSFFSAVRATGVAVGTVVAIGSAPVFTGLISRLTGGPALTGRWLLATAGAIAGAAVLVTGGRAAGVNLGGVGLAAVAGLCYAAYAVTAARLVTGGTSERAVMGALFGGGAVLLLPVLLASPAGWLLTARGVLVTAQLGIMTTAAAYLLYGRGLRTVPAPVAVTLGLAEPVVAALLALAVLGERLSAPAIAGLILVGLALAILMMPGGRGVRAPPGASTPPGRTPLTPA
jgi:drug/metabolite transporter, DME family